MPRYFQGTEIDTLHAAGFSIRFYDLDEGFNVDIDSVEERIDGSVSALYIIHYFGLPQNLDALEAVCKRHGIALIEDCALAFLSRHGESWVGSRGDMALFSIYKSVPLPHGGYLVTKHARENAPLSNPPRFSTLLQTAELVAQHIRRTAANRHMNRFWEQCFATENIAENNCVRYINTGYDIPSLQRLTTGRATDEFLQSPRDHRS